MNECSSITLISLHSNVRYGYGLLYLSINVADQDNKQVVISWSCAQYLRFIYNAYDECILLIPLDQTQ